MHLSLSLSRVSLSLCLCVSLSPCRCPPLLPDLDPHGIHDEDKVWWALEQVNLKVLFVAKTDGLRHQLDVDGSNLSQGQRQLLCLARVLLCHAKVPFPGPLVPCHSALPGSVFHLFIVDLLAACSLL